MEPIWVNNVRPAVSDFMYAIYLVFAFFAARFFLDRFIFRGVATWLLRRRTTHLKIDELTGAKIVKCSESMWKLAYYGTMEFCVLKVAYHEPWFLDITEYFRDWPNQEIKAGIKFLYMCQCGFYLYSIAALLVWETRRKDFSVMMSHHIVTVLLISSSYISSFFRIGVVILALHDVSDVFMEAAKVFKYSEKELGASLFFGLFAISWFAFRLVFFPFWVIRSSRSLLNQSFASLPCFTVYSLTTWMCFITSYYLCEVLRLSEAYHSALYYGFNTMLLTLLVFHLYWWILICSMITRQLKNRGKVGEDVRSDSEGDD